jgi:outer membrane protein assembly factor BamA
MRGKLFLVLVLFNPATLSKGQDSLSSDSLTIREIIVEGNNITSNKLILRELDFRVGENVSRSEVEYKRQTSKNNLIKLSIFNFVEIEIKETPGNNLTTTVRLTERWYIWPSLYLNHTDNNFSEWWRTKDLNKLEYGVGLKINNFRGFGETLLLDYHIGNFTKYDLNYLGIYIDKAKRHSLSVSASYAAQNVVPWNIESNKLVTLRQTDKLFNETDLSLKYIYRKRYFNTHLIEFGYSHIRIADTILKLNPYFLGLNKKDQRYFNLRYEFTRDTRDSRIYPKTGYLFVAGINKKGLGILDGEFDNINIYMQLFNYWKLQKRLYVASGLLYSTNRTNDYAFFFQTGLGHLQFVRGYEYYTINGSNSLLLKSLFKFELLPVKVINLNIWPIRKLYQFNKIPFEIYTNVFFDAGYVSDKFEFYKQYNNTLVNKIIYSTGLGVDFITYYDIVMRFDYSFNSIGERGLFIHWKAAIR